MSTTQFLLYVIGWNRGPRQRTERSLRGHEHKIVRLNNPPAGVPLREKQPPVASAP